MAFIWEAFFLITQYALLHMNSSSLLGMKAFLQCLMLRMCLHVVIIFELWEYSNWGHCRVVTIFSWCVKTQNLRVCKHSRIHTQWFLDFVLHQVMQASTKDKIQFTLEGLWCKYLSLSWEPLRDTGVKLELLKYKSSKLMPKKCLGVKWMTV